MDQKLFTVNDRFDIKQRNGLAVVGEYQPDLPNFNLKDEIVFVRPDGTKITANIADSETIQTVSGNKMISILVKNLSKEDVPIGTEIFLK